MTEYQILEDTSINDLVGAVNMAIKQGWKPRGGICILNRGQLIKYYQAMIK